MTTLLILRHAHAKCPDDVDDHDRPLSRRGSEAARLVGAALGSIATPRAVLCSTALRARRTAEIVIESAGLHGASLELTDDLYLAGDRTIIGVLAQQPDGSNPLLIVGHNPGLQELVLALSGASVALATASLARIELRIGRWRDLPASLGSARLAGVWRPEELPVR